MAGATIGSMNVSLGLNHSKFGAGLKNAGRGVQTFGDRVRGSLGSLTGMAGRLAVTGGALVGVGSIAGGLGLGVKLAAEFEQAEVAMTTMLGSASMARKILGDLTDFAATTPFQFPELQSAAQKLIAFGISTEKLMPAMQALGDVSAGIGAPIGEIAEIYGKARVQGRLFAEDINQLTGRGVPIIGELAKQFGVAESEVKKLVESGKVNFGNLELAFQSLAGEGGQFSGLMAAQSRTLLGLFSTLKDNIGLFARDVAQILLEAFNIKGGMEGAIAAIGSFRESAVSAVQKVAVWIKMIPLIFEFAGINAAIVVLSTMDTIWAAVKFVMGNLPVLAENLGIAFQTAFSNIAVVATNLFTKFPMLLKGFGNIWLMQWQNYWQIVKNVGENIKNLFWAVFEAIRTQSLEPFSQTLTVSLTKGTQNMVTPLLDLAEELSEGIVPAKFKDFAVGFEKKDSALTAGLRESLKQTEEKMRGLTESAGKTAAELKGGIDKAKPDAAGAGGAGGAAAATKFGLRQFDPRRVFVAGLNDMEAKKESKESKAQKTREETRDLLRQIVEGGGSLAIALG